MAHSISHRDKLSKARNAAMWHRFYRARDVRADPEGAERAAAFRHHFLHDMARRSRELAKERSGCARPIAETQKANLTRRKHIPITLPRISFMETD